MPGLRRPTASLSEDVTKPRAMRAHYTIAVGAGSALRGYDSAMNLRLSVGVLALLVAFATACSGVSSDSFPRATRAPEVRCMTPPPAGAPGQDPNAQPMFYFFCMQSP
jgi:hypothetical protein